MDILGAIFGSSETGREGWWPVSVFGGRRTAAGTTVSSTTALGLPAYFACIKVLSEDTAGLPLRVYRKTKSGGKEEADDHRLSELLALGVSDEQDSLTFRETMTQWAAGWGNGYAEIERDNSGRLVALHAIHPSRVEIKRIDGVLTYLVRSEVPGHKIVPLLAPDVFHLRGLGDGIAGWSVAQVGAESIGAALAAQGYAATYYGNNTAVGGTLEHPGKLSPEAQAALRESWNTMHQGPENAHKVAILQEGMKFHGTSVNPRDAQFIEGRNFDVEAVCKWFRMPPHKVQHLLRSTNNNIEHQSIEYVTDTLMPWLMRWESEIKRKLLNEDRALYAKHQVNGRMRGDAAARGMFYSQLRQMGAISADEIRAFEDMEPIGTPAAQAYFVQGALVTMDNAMNTKPGGQSAPAADAPAKPTNKPAQVDEENDTGDEP